MSLPAHPQSQLTQFSFQFTKPFYCMLTGLQLTLRGMSEALVDKRVAPALVTLSVILNCEFHRLRP